MTHSFDQSKDEIARLVKHFATNVAQYRAPGYKEANARQEFINPLFSALGWDVSNVQHAAPDYREVVVEPSLDVEGHQKAPDYAFRIGREPKFYVEAKKPGVDLRTDPGPAYQLRRYAWTARLPLSILTDFEEFAVYDCRKRPSHRDKPAVSRTDFYSYEEYSDCWPKIWEVFSKEAVLGGTFDKAAGGPTRRGATEVDAEFLKEIERWRDALARNFALRNPTLTVEGLNDAVQRTIDRIVFLRMAEDRGMEEYGRLERLAEIDGTYAGLLRIARLADDKYNSGLFDFSRDKLTAHLLLDDKVLAPILKSLYFPQSPYAFRVLPPEILGSVYERFLGKVIRLTPGHQAKVEEKPEVRKAGGVYYTPGYIVDYIVQQTVTKQIAGKSPTQLRGYRVLDMACGSGSFLVGAYRALLDHYTQWYSDHHPERHSKAVYTADTAGYNPDPGLPLQEAESSCAYRLTTAEKKRILTEHIFGVDIDHQAVEVTKLSLLLQVLEGETDETLGKQMQLLHDRALPDLESNIKCGNSLIGPDYFTRRLLPDGEELRRVNPFDWIAEFPEVMKHGGFHAAIGNPPYLKIEHMTELDRAAYSSTYRAYKKRYDAFGLFIERGLDLLGDAGTLGMIIPSTILNNLSFSELRRLLIEQTNIRRIVNLGGKVFTGVNNDTLIIMLDKGIPPGETEVFDVASYGASLGGAAPTGRKSLTRTASPPGYVFELRVLAEDEELLQKLSQTHLRLSELTRGFQGLVTGSNEAFIVDGPTIKREKLERVACKPAVFGDEVARYAPPSPKSYVIYLSKHSSLDEYPHIRARLDPFKQYLQRKREVQLGRQPWYALHWPRVRENFETRPKILVQAIRNLSLKRRVIATLDDASLFADHTLNVLLSKDNSYSIAYLLGIINSALINFLFTKKFVDINIKGVYLADIPIRSIDFSDPTDNAAHGKMVLLVQQMLELQRRRQFTDSDDERELIYRQINATDQEIDALVYELYGLTDQEIALVEAAYSSGAD